MNIDKTIENNITNTLPVKEKNKNIKKDNLWRFQSLNKRNFTTTNVLFMDTEDDLQTRINNLKLHHDNTKAPGEIPTNDLKELISTNDISELKKAIAENLENMKKDYFLDDDGFIKMEKDFNPSSTFDEAFPNLDKEIVEKINDAVKEGENGENIEFTTDQIEKMKTAAEKIKENLKENINNKQSWIKYKDEKIMMELDIKEVKEVSIKIFEEIKKWDIDFNASVNLITTGLTYRMVTKIYEKSTKPSINSTVAEMDRFNIRIRRFNLLYAPLIVASLFYTSSTFKNPSIDVNVKNTPNLDHTVNLSSPLVIWNKYPKWIRSIIMYFFIYLIYKILLLNFPSFFDYLKNIDKGIVIITIFFWLICIQLFYFLELYLLIKFSNCKDKKEFKNKNFVNKLFLKDIDIEVENHIYYEVNMSIKSNIFVFILNILICIGIYFIIGF